MSESELLALEDALVALEYNERERAREAVARLRVRTDRLDELRGDEPGSTTEMRPWHFVGKDLYARVKIKGVAPSWLQVIPLVTGREAANMGRAIREQGREGACGDWRWPG